MMHETIYGNLKRCTYHRLPYVGECPACAAEQDEWAELNAPPYDYDELTEEGGIIVRR